MASSPRLYVALSASLIITFATTTVSYVRDGQGTLAAVIGKPVVFIVLAVLALSRRAWARWILIAWLAIGCIHAATYVYGVTGTFKQQALLFGMAAIAAWACVELALDGLARSEASGRAAA